MDRYKNLSRLSYFGSHLRGRFFQIMKHYIGPYFKYSFKWNHYYEKRIMDLDEGTNYLIKLIQSDKPFMAGRFGTTECQTFVRKLEIEMGLRSTYGNRLDMICTFSGFFPNDKILLDKYCDLVTEEYSEVDLLAIMNVLGEDFVVKNFCCNTKLTRLEVVDPIFWSYALEGKKVLVIHPMSKTIEKQYSNKQEKIYAGTNILPKFQLSTIKAIQTISGQKDERFSTWFDALNYMKSQIDKQDFDIALIGAGAYGFPLAVHVKRIGKKAIHMGGSLQLLFGIKGARWDNNKSYMKYFNDSWVRPDESEIPKNYKIVEGGCYW